MKIINRFTGATLFEVDDWAIEGKDLVEKAVKSGANLRGANLFRMDLMYADLWRADLRYANLISADLRYADLRDADLRGADLRMAKLEGVYLLGANLLGADLEPIKSDVFAVLARAELKEVAGFALALKEGRVDGPAYASQCKYDEILGLMSDPYASRPAERFFLGIRGGDMPETNQHARIALDWVEEFLSKEGVTA